MQTDVTEAPAVQMQARVGHEQSKDRRRKLVLGFAAIAVLLMGLAAVGFYQQERLAGLVADLQGHADLTPAGLDSGTVDSDSVKTDSQGRSDAKVTTPQDASVTLPGMLQTARAAIMARRKVVIAVSVALVVLLIAGGITFGVLYQQSLDDQELAAAEVERQRLESERLEQAEADRIAEEQRRAEEARLAGEKEQSAPTISWPVVVVPVLAVFVLTVAVIVVIKWPFKASNYISTS